MRRRIIRSEHSKLAGLALLLLSKIFPVNERSGLNLKGERNLNNCNLKLILESANDENMLFWKLHELLYLVPQDVNDIFKPMQKVAFFICNICKIILLVNRLYSRNYWNCSWGWIQDSWCGAICWLWLLLASIFNWKWQFF